MIGFVGPIDVQSLRLYGLPEAVFALLCGMPAWPVGQRESATQVAWDLPSLASGATSLLDVTVSGVRQAATAASIILVRGERLKGLARYRP